MTFSIKGWPENIFPYKEALEACKELSAVPKEFLCPKQENVFRAFRECPYDHLKIVMLGQEPYPQKGVATGILFGNDDTEETNLSPSLKIIKEAVIDYTIPHKRIIFDNTLVSWCKQGVLMINSALTTIQGKTECHSLIWRPFLRQLLINLSKYSPGLVYVLFGTRAKELSMYIGKNNHVLYENHPAYYARKSLAMPTTVFKQIDKLMEMYYENMIWYEED